MRVGFNPHKDKIQDISDFFHHVIVPVYIPNSENYFKDSFTILKYNLESLFKTSHSKTYFTIANNGSCDEIATYLNELKKEGKIHEVIHTTNIGKLNSVIKSLCGHQFQFITITDADVLFLNNWQTETYSVFNSFPKVGAVCPTPSPKSVRTFTSNILFDLFFSNKLKFTKVKNPDALKMFAKSIDYEFFYNDYHLNKILTVTSNNCKAVVGAGHFVTTFRAEVFKELNIKYSKYKLGGTSETEILDLPVVKIGLWRLSTEDNFAYHMGNVIEPWMEKVFNEIETMHSLNGSNNFIHHYIPQGKISYWIKVKLFGKLIYNKRIMKLFFRYKGLSADAAENYI